MFSQIFDAIEEWMRGLLTGMINSNLDRMFTDVNQKTGEIASQVGQTPQGWNSSIFSMIENLSNSVIMPIAGIIITFVLCYELISMLSYVKYRHRDCKCITHQIDCDPHFYKILEEHPGINIMHIVPFCPHRNQLITENKRDLVFQSI